MMIIRKDRGVKKSFRKTESRRPRIRMKEAWSPMDNVEIRNSVDMFLSKAIERLFYKPQVFKNQEEFEEFIQDEILNMKTDGSEILGLTVEEMIDLCDYASEILSPLQGVSYEELSLRISEDAIFSLLYLASEQIEISEIEKYIEEDFSKIEWSDTDTGAMLRPIEIQDTKAKYITKYIYDDIIVYEVEIMGYKIYGQFNK